MKEKILHADNQAPVQSWPHRELRDKARVQSYINKQIAKTRKEKAQ